MFDYKQLTEMESEHRPRSRLSILSRQSSDADCHSQFSEEEFQKDLHKRPNVVGPGGIPLPKQKELNEMLDEEKISVMCFTWNIAGKPASGLLNLNELFRKIPNAERSDVITIALQELPASTIRFHSDMVAIMERALEDTHRVYCWVRKWSQMVMIFIRKKLSLYASYPEYQFVATTRLASPFRTKGAIGICFRILQTNMVFIACHLTHGKVNKRVSDYHKLSKAFDFKMLRIHGHRHKDEERSPLKRAGCVFWFGDLNFRLSRIDAMDVIRTQLEDKLFREQHDFSELLKHDELNAEKAKGLVFCDFKEGEIKFPPTHKFIRDTNVYTANRIPSYTDRVLFWSHEEDELYPIRYDCVWELSMSDHKPVYCTFKMKVVSQRSCSEGSVVSQATSSTFTSLNSPMTRCNSNIKNGF